MRKVLGLFGAAAMALAAMVSPGTTTGADKVSHQQGKEKALPQHIGHRQHVVQSAGGYDVIGYGGGIPPQIYGECFVRRGTHKRTNRR